MIVTGVQTKGRCLNPVRDNAYKAIGQSDLVSIYIDRPRDEVCEMSIKSEIGQHHKP